MLKTWNSQCQYKKHFTDYSGIFVPYVEAMQGQSPVLTRNSNGNFQTNSLKEPEEYKKELPTIVSKKHYTKKDSSVFIKKVEIKLNLLTNFLKYQSAGW